MAKYLVIVESPAKVKTIKKFLGKNYEVVASNGHVRDLPKSQMGIDIENDFEPKYITIRGKGDILAKLRKEAKKADKVYLATDPDREGEAISWHLSQALKLDDKNAQRITFNEITQNAVKASLKEPRKIDINLVDAQQTRRILDRLVGYEISPLLWAKVKRGLSAGRVQSVALRIICDREDEINAFIPEEYWTLDAELSVKGERKTLLAKFYGDENGKQRYFMFNGINAAQAPQNSFVKDVITAYNYNVANGGGENMQAIATDKKMRIGAVETGYDNVYLPNANAIRFNPTAGLKLDDGNILSPATGLEHEAAHAVNNKKGVDSKINNKYGTTEERSVIKGAELKTAKANGELPANHPGRKSHADGQWVVTRSVISNKEFSTKSSEELRKKIKEFRNSYTPEP